MTRLDEEVPTQTCKSKHFITKVMFAYIGTKLRNILKGNRIFSHLLIWNQLNEMVKLREIYSVYLEKIRFS